MEYTVVIYIGSTLITALDVIKGDYISMNGNRTHPADDIDGFYKNIVDNYSVNDLIYFNPKVIVINGGTSKENIKNLYDKFVELEYFSLWRVEELLPVIVLQKKLIRINDKLKISIHDKDFFVIKSDSNFNLTVELVGGLKKTECINLTLKDLGTIFNGMNGRSLSYYDDWIKDEEKLEKTKKQKDELTKLKKMCDFEIGDTIEFGKVEKGPLKWTVLKKDYEDNTMIIMCNNLRKKMRFFEFPLICSWENSSLRKWLNNDFLEQSFNEEERKRIDLIDGDHITILSREECYEYLSKEQRKKSYWTRTVVDDNDIAAMFKVIGKGKKVCLCNGSTSECDAKHHFWTILKYKVL